jgi:hypothetical protein
MSAKIVGTAHDGGSATSFTITLPTTDYDYLTVKIENPVVTIVSNVGIGDSEIPPYHIYTIKKPSSTYTFYFKSFDNTLRDDVYLNSSYANNPEIGATVNLRSN